MMLEFVKWEFITFQELDTLLRIGEAPEFSLDEELSSRLTPLCLACKYNREDLVSILLYHGASPSTRCSYYNKQPLHFACDHSSGNLGTVKQLLEANAEVNARDDDGNSGLHLACTQSNVPVVELLITHQANVNLTDMDGETPLVRACYAVSIELTEILLKAGCDPNAPHGQPLEIAVRTPSVETLKLLIEAGANVCEGAYLSHASEHNHIEMMKILHNYGADVNKPNALGMTPLQTACCSGQASLTTVHLLLHWGANVDAFSTMRETALHYACSLQDVNKIRLLLAYGADVNVRDSHKLPPLMMVLKNPTHNHLTSRQEVCINIVKLLLAAGAVLTSERLKRLKTVMLFFQNIDAHGQELLNILEQHVSGPPSLQSICRISIRKAVVPNVDENALTLPLPPQLIRFLTFLDIVE